MSFVNIKNQKVYTIFLENISQIDMMSQVRDSLFQLI